MTAKPLEGLEKMNPESKYESEANRLVREIKDIRNYLNWLETRLNELRSPELIKKAKELSNE